MRAVLFGLFFLILTHASAQNIEAFGVFGGFNFPFTVDPGLNKDPRFVGRLTFRGTPVGFSYGYDRVGHGILITPNYTQAGQKFIIKNTTGGEIGTRDVQMNYLSIPIALKLHINDMSFFRLSLVAAISPSFLMKGQETFTIKSPDQAAKLRYPAGVSVPTEPGYEKVYDGVFVPQLDNDVHVSNDKFNSFQLFAALGLRSDFDLNDDWSINFDGRANFGIFDPRKSTYIEELKNPAGPEDFYGNPGAPDLYGQRREIFLSVSFGISRIIQIKQKFKSKQSTSPALKSAPKPRTSTNSNHGGMSKSKGKKKKN